MTAFLKMHGLGNDFAVFDARKGDLKVDPALARAIADRKTGIGCDQIIVIGRPRDAAADAEMRIYNADGGEVESCGNAARCIARYLMDERDTTSVRIATLGGLLASREDEAGRVSVDMGTPRFGWNEIPLAEPVDTNGFPLTVEDTAYVCSAVSVGNPHCIVFVSDVAAVPLAEIGPRFEHHTMFPARINTEFVQVVSPTQLRMRVWERGAGITRACGTGACAVAVAAHRRGLTERKVDVVLDGGTLQIEWREADGHIIMTGPTTLAYRGEVDLAALEPRA